MSDKQKIAESYQEAEYLLRMVIYESSMRELIGYQSAKEIIAYLKQNYVRDRLAYTEAKKGALEEALNRVKGKPYIKNWAVANIEDTEDVELSVKELLRASGIDSSVDEFFVALIKE